jgi:hypothetical protein
MAKYKPVGNANWGECDYCLEQPMVTRYDVEYEVYESGPSQVHLSPLHEQDSQ